MFKLNKYNKYANTIWYKENWITLWISNDKLISSQYDRWMRESGSGNSLSWGMRVWICDVSEPAKDQDQKAEPLQWDKLEHCDTDHLKKYVQLLLSLKRLKWGDSMPTDIVSVQGRFPKALPSCSWFGTAQLPTTLEYHPQLSGDVSWPCYGHGSLWQSYHQLSSAIEENEL